MTLVMMLLTGLLIWRDWPVWTLPLANVVVCLGTVWIGPRMPKGPSVNRKIRLPGSRFYPPLTEQATG
jgi:hypothetical protein